MSKSLFLLLFLSFPFLLKGQNTGFYSFLGKNIHELTQQRVEVVAFFSKKMFLSNPEKKKEQNPFSKNSYVIPKQARYYCYDKLAFFCKLEVKMEQQFHAPIKFRLGSVDYVDGLEGK